MGVEVLSVLRVVAVLISVGGVILIGIPEFQKSDARMIGNSFALVGAFLYGVYSVYLKRISIDESRISMPLLFAFSGLYTLLFGWIVLLGLHLRGSEVFELPPDPAVYGYLAFNIIFGGLIPNYLWNVAFVCTSPLVVAIGISFNIPLTLVVEYYLKIRRGEVDVQFFDYRFWAGICVVIGFIVVNLSNIYPQLDLACERFFARLGIIREADIRSTRERAEKLRNRLIDGSFRST